MNNTPKAKSRPVRRRKNGRSSYRIKRPVLIFGGIVLILFLGILGYIGAFGLHCMSSKIFKETVHTMVCRNDTPAKAFPGQNEVNVLLMGRDLDRDRHGNIIRTRGRTDAMMLAHIDFKQGTCNILSIPRDTLVKIPGYPHKQRVSYANAFGGPDLAQQTVSEFLGVQPDYYMLVNFEGFEKAIDSMGGLKVDVDKELDYDDNWGSLHIHLKPGQHLLNGYESMGFVRYRKDNQGHGDSDLIRCGRQQAFLRAVMLRLASPNVMFKVPKCWI